MPLPALTTPVPHSVGLNRPQRQLPPGACDSHMHIFDPVSYTHLTLPTILLV